MLSRNRVAATPLIYLLVAAALLAGCDGSTGYTEPDVRGNGEVVPHEVAEAPDTLPAKDGAPASDSAPDAMVDEIVDVPDSAEAFALLGAFSGDGQIVTVRFSRAPAPDGAADPARYTLLGDDVPYEAFRTATVDGALVQLELADSLTLQPRGEYRLLVNGVHAADGGELPEGDTEVPVHRPLYIAFVWHHHQPPYEDAWGGGLAAPWVRHTSTKDFYDMAALVEGYPDVHFTINPTFSYLDAAERFYVEPLGPYVDPESRRVDAAAFLAAERGTTDPWLDLLLEETPAPEALTERQRGLLYEDMWSCMSTSMQLAAYFPDYEALRYADPATYTREDLRLLKIMFALAWLDPMFLREPVELPDGWVVDLSDVVEGQRDGAYRLVGPASEDMANRLVAESWAILKNIPALYRRLQYRPEDHSGQIELAVSPYHSPLLPLLVDTELAHDDSPHLPLPTLPFAEPADAADQVLRAVGAHERLFGAPPRGLIPSELALAEAALPALDAERTGLTWTLVDDIALPCCSPPDLASHRAYRVDEDREPGDGGSTQDELAVFMRSDALSTTMGWEGQQLPPDEAVTKLLGELDAARPRFGAPDRVITVSMNGGCGWESNEHSHDGEAYLHALYAALDAAGREGSIFAVTPSEYLQGNPLRGIPAHPVGELEEIEPLATTSWMRWSAGADSCGNFDAWLGEPEENTAWEYLALAREALRASGLPRPDARAPAPDAERSPADYHVWAAYDAMFAAESADFFWVFGDDVAGGPGEEQLETLFLGHLGAVYAHANAALRLLGESELPEPSIWPLSMYRDRPPYGPYSTPPDIDGWLDPGLSEWLAPGGLLWDYEPWSGPDAGDRFNSVLWGWDDDAFYVAVRAARLWSDIAAESSGSYELALYFSQKRIVDSDPWAAIELPANPNSVGGAPLGFRSDGATTRLALTLTGSETSLSFWKADGAGGWEPEREHGVDVGGPHAGSDLIELRIPWRDLDTGGAFDPLEMAVIGTQSCETADALESDRAPNEGAFELFEDRTTYVDVTFEVDASGTLLPLDSEADLCTPPRAGGRISIVGNHESLGLDGADWGPNRVLLTPDEEEDGVWTKTVALPRAFPLEYKYTVGLPENLNRWYCTEEFPITVRGWTLPVSGDVASVTIRDVFADRPEDGELGGLTTVVCRDADAVEVPCE